jgi:hypothetical protein
VCTWSLGALCSEHIYCKSVEVDALETTTFEDDHNFHEPRLNHPIVAIKKELEYRRLHPLFGQISPDLIKRLSEHTTQYTQLLSGTVLKRSFRSLNPALNVTHRHEAVACDIADVPPISNDSVVAVPFVGIDSQVSDDYGIKTDKQFVNTLEDTIIQRGAPHKLISDSAQVIIGNKAQNILRTFCISHWHREPHQQHHIAAERRFQTIKRSANGPLDRTGTQANTLLLCLQYVCYLLNHT